MSVTQTVGPVRWSIRTQPRRASDLREQANEWLAQCGAENGQLQLFALHTSCGLLITENADFDVQSDMEMMFQRWAPDGDPAYRHGCEGPDDMPAHLRSILTGSALTIPVSAGKLLLGTWQGVYLYEHRAHPHSRQIAATFVGDLQQ